MILSGRDIKDYLSRGLIKIEPLAPSQIQQNGVDLLLVQVIHPPHKQSESFMHKGEFYLGCTQEVLTLPNDIIGFVELRSTLARKGILIAPTIVDAGFSGNLTVEIFTCGFQGYTPIGERFLHLVFAKMLSEGDPYRGKYQNQRGITCPID